MTISIWPALARRAFGVALMLVVVLLPAFVYLRVSSDRPVHVIGSDAFGYEWQIRAIGAAKLAQIGTRPGVAGLGGILTGIGVLPEKAAPPILGLALATALGLAAGAVVRIAFALPDWAVGVVAGFVVLWGGTARMANGYLATVASLVAFAAGLALVVSRGRGHPTFAAFTCFLVACLTHPGLAPAYVGIVAAWVFLSAPSIVRERATRPWWRSEPVVAFGILVAAAALTVLLVIGILGFTVGDVAEFQAADFGGRLAVTARLVLGPVLVAAAAGGATVAWLGLRNNRSGCVLARLGLAWLVVTLAGSALTLFDPSFPGHRALLLALPLPIAAGLGVSGAVGLAGRVSGPAVGRVGVAIVAWGIGVVVLVLAAGPAVAWFRPVTVPLKDVGLMDVGAYAAAVDPTTPIVVVADPGRLPGILFWKARLNQIRAFAPRDAITRIVLYLGAPSRAVLGNPRPSPTPKRRTRAPTTAYPLAFGGSSGRRWMTPRRSCWRLGVSCGARSSPLCPPT